MSEHESPNDIRIKGGAGPFEAAAIAAVISQIVRDEQLAAATPPNRHRFSEWSTAGRKDVFVPPIAPPARRTRNHQRSDR